MEFAFTVWSILFLFNIWNILFFSTLDYFLLLDILKHLFIKSCFFTFWVPIVYFIFWTFNLMNHFLFHWSLSISLSFIILPVPTFRHIYFPLWGIFTSYSFFQLIFLGQYPPFCHSDEKIKVCINKNAMLLDLHSMREQNLSPFIIILPHGCILIIIWS